MTFRLYLILRIMNRKRSMADDSIATPAPNNPNLGTSRKSIGMTRSSPTPCRMETNFGLPSAIKA
ncbi:hypothetical protein D3C76_1536080 [compost metagenome]